MTDKQMDKQPDPASDHEQADQLQADESLAAETPADETPAEGEERTAVEAAAEPPTAAAEEEAPQRWSGSAAVPPHVPKKSRWSRRSPGLDEEPVPAVDPWAESEDWSAIPAVDPWADHDTPLDLQVPFPEALPPTRIDAPATLPPTRVDAPAAPPNAQQSPTPSSPAGRSHVGRASTGQAPSPPPGPSSAAPTQASPPQSTSAAAPAPKPTWLARMRKTRERPTPQPNRLPVQPRPTAPPPPQPTKPPRPAKPPQLTKPPQPTKPPQLTKPPQGIKPSPARPAAPPPRRKRRWGRRLFVFTLLSALCCCGIPGYFLSPLAEQYPVSAVLPQTVGDLDLRDDDAGQSAVDRLSEDLQGTLILGGEPFAGVYADNDGKRVTVFGTTGLRLTPQSDVEAELAHLTGEFAIKDVQAYDLGVTGLHERCGIGRSQDDTVVVCAWADHGSLATALFTRRSAEESAQLTGKLRTAILNPRFGGNLDGLI